LKTLSQINVGDAWIELRRVDEHPQYIRTSSIISVSFDDLMVETANVTCGSDSFTISATDAADLMRLVSSQTSATSRLLLASKGSEAWVRFLKHGQKCLKQISRLFGKHTSEDFPQPHKNPQLLCRPLSFQCVES